MEIKVTVRNKRASGDNSVIVCGNSDYSVKFDLDSEWDAFSIKTMLVVCNDGTTYSVQFEGDTANLPALHNIHDIRIGIMAGNIHTTTGAYFRCSLSIKDVSGAAVEPPEDVYAQLVEALTGKITEPAEEGADGQVLTTDGKGGRSWTSVSGGGIDVTGAKLGQIVQVSSVDENGKPTGWIPVDIPEQKQSDWNQNDTAAADYVKNRPFYSGDPVETVLVEESTVAFEDGGSMYLAKWPESLDWVEGQTYTVKFDGTEYSCVCQIYEGSSIVIGNLSIVGAGDDSGEPFLIFSNEPWATATLDTSASHVISISTSVPEVKKIDQKYLPVIKGADGESVTVSTVSESTEDGGSNVVTFSDGKTMTVRNGRKGSTGAQGPKGNTGNAGSDGKSAYAYAKDGGYTGTEAEFSAKLAEEIPTELPNPAALTFTGAVTGTYDGSEALTVEIPSGGAVSDEQVNSAVSAWLTEHPEATTTVQDGSVSEEKTTFFTKSFVELIGEMEVGFQDTSLSGYHKKTFAVEPGKTYILNGGQWFTYYDSNMTDISGAADWTFVNSGLIIPSTDGKQYINKILTVPESSELRYIRITVQDGGMTDSYPSCYEGPANIGLIPRGSSLTKFDYANNKKVQNAFEIYSGENLIDASQCTLNSGNIYYSQLIPVQPGEKYYKAYKPGGLELFNYYGQGFPYKWTAGVDWFPSTGTVVTGRNDGVYIIPENAYYARTGCTMTDGAVNEWFVKSPKIITSVQVGKPFIASDADRNTVKEYLDGQHLVGLKLCCLGDSVTNQSQYGSAIADKYNMTNIAGGTDGASYTSATGLNSNQIAYNKVNSLDADTDVVVLMFGTNDISNSRAIGSFTDNDLTTLYGALRKTYDLLTTKFSGKRIGVVTSPQRNFNTVSYDTWKQYNDVIKKMAMLYKIPVLDGEYAGLVYGLSNDYSHFTDDVHPSSVGGKALAYNIGKFVETLPVYHRDGE